MASILDFDVNTGLHPKMTKINPLTGQAYGVNDKAAGVVPSYQVKTDPAFHQQGFKDTSKGTIDSTVDIGDAKQPTVTAKAVVHYADSAAYALKGGVAIANGYIGKMSAEMKAMTYDFKAKQNRRAADLLLANQTEITRAAQMDSNQYRIAGVETKAKQVSGMAASGFAVGKGVYKNTLNTTEARVNYNVANLMLKADLQNAELTRSAGQQLAEAIINDANKEIAKKEGKFSVMNGWLNGISNFISAGASFTCGMVENGAFGKTSTSTITKTKK